MSISVFDAKKAAGGVCNLYDRCIETPNFYEVYKDEDYHLKRSYVSKATGKLVESKLFLRDFYHDLWMRKYELAEEEDKIIREYKYCYYPDLNAVTKSDGCTFFDTERGFIFDIDGDWIRKDVLGGSRPCSIISADEAFAIINREEYEFLFFSEKMNDGDVKYYEEMGMPYRLKRA